MKEQKHRKLAAILFADIVGYTALMQKGEATAMSTLHRFETVTQKAVEKHDGEIIKTYGDGSLLLFPSTVNAVQCAYDMQLAFKETPKVPLRIGIHVGEIIRKGKDIFGNGVNIAARVESMGVAGSVLLSKNAQEKIRNQEGFQTQSLGIFEFKNVEEPMEVFALANEGLAIPAKDSIKGKIQKTNWSPIPKGFWIPILLFTIVSLGIAFLPSFFSQEKTTSKQKTVVNKKSIAVLPFTDLSPQQDQGYFSIGMMEEILNHLVKIEGLTVTSRTSVMQYVNTTTPISDISKELGVANVLEGSVRKAGDQVRISVQLIDGNTDKHIWSETYDKKMEDIFGIQSDVAQSIAAVLETEIYPEVKNRIEISPTLNLEAYDLWLKGNNENFATPEAIAYYHKAIEIDSNFAPAYAALGNVWINKGGFVGQMEREEVLPKATYYINKAVEKDAQYAPGHRYLAQLKLWYYWDFEAAEKSFNTYLKLNPSRFNGNLLDYFLATQQFKKGVEWAKRINQIENKVDNGWGRLGLAYIFAGNYETGKQYNEQALALFPNRWFLKNDIARGYLYMGDYEKVIELVAELLEENPSTRFPRALGISAIAYQKVGQDSIANTLIQELKENSATSPVGSPSFYLAMYYAQLGDVDTAFEWLEKSFATKEVEMYWLKSEPPFEPLRQDARWEMMLDKVGFLKNIKG